MCTSVNPNTNQLGLTHYQSVVLSFDTVSYRANWYSLAFEQVPPIVSFHKHDKIFASDLYGRLQRLAILNAHTDLPLIFYLLLKKPVDDGYRDKYRYMMVIHEFHVLNCGLEWTYYIFVFSRLECRLCEKTATLSLQRISRKDTRTMWRKTNKSMNFINSPQRVALIC